MAGNAWSWSKAIHVQTIPPKDGLERSASESLGVGPAAANRGTDEQRLETQNGIGGATASGLPLALLPHASGGHSVSVRVRHPDQAGAWHAACNVTHVTRSSRAE